MICKTHIALVVDDEKFLDLCISITKDSNYSYKEIIFASRDNKSFYEIKDIFAKNNNNKKRFHTADGLKKFEELIEC